MNIPSNQSAFSIASMGSFRSWSKQRQYVDDSKPPEPDHPDNGLRRANDIMIKLQMLSRQGIVQQHPA
jgi:hypothetical protein